MFEGYWKVWVLKGPRDLVSGVILIRIIKEGGEPLGLSEILHLEVPNSVRTLSLYTASSARRGSSFIPDPACE